MKNKLLTVLVIAALVIVVGIYFYASSQNSTISSVINKAINNVNNPAGSSDRGSNGYWDASKQYCFATKEMVKVFKLDTLKNNGMFACCFDTEGYQIYCEDSAKRLSNEPVLNNPATYTYAIYTTSAGTNPGGVGTIAHGVTLTNSGNIDYTKVWIQSASWTNTPTYTGTGYGLAEVNRAWNSMIGFNNAQAVELPQGTGTQFSFIGPIINAQVLSPNKNTAETYNLTLTAMGSYSIEGVASNYTATQTSWFKVTKEEPGFNVVINLNAPKP